MGDFGSGAPELPARLWFKAVTLWSAYEERRFALRPGDCLLLTTDGVNETADAHDEEFGNERVVASARAARSLGAQGIRTWILDDVTRFCNGNFHDDASLIVVTVD